MYSFFFNNHRKLLNDSDDIKLCEPYCDQIDNQDGACPLQCLTRCYPICNHPILFDPPPPPPPPPPVFISYDDYHQASKSHKLSLFFTLSLAILAATFLLFAIYTAYKFYKGRYFPWRNRSPPPPPPVNQPQDEVPMVREYFLDQDIGSMVDHPIWYIRTVGLQPSIINSISTCKFKKSDGLVEGTECSVCLNEFQEDEILRLLPKCQHAFHISCIDTWLRSHINCPLCRALIVIPTSNSISQSTTLSNIVESQIVENRVSDTEAETPENPELSIHVDNDIESRFEDVRSSNVHLIRRSVSMDSLAASDISAAAAIMMTSGSNKEIDSSEKVCSSSNETKGPSIMVKRSLSCSAKVFLSRYSKGRSSAAALPPPPAEAAAL